MSEHLNEGQNKVALLIDGDNASASLISPMLAEANKFGTVTIRRIFGDWTTGNMKGWKDTLNNYAIEPIQQFRYTVGKNATDSAMIINAMDLLHSGHVDCFCLVSSDSDYTRLATRIREAGIFVVGMGEKKTPKAFVNACHQFIFVENLQKTGKKHNHKSVAFSKLNIAVQDELTDLLTQAFDMAMREDGWAHLSTMGIYLRQLDPGFDARTYGFSQLSQLIQSQKEFEVRRKEVQGVNYLFVRMKNEA